MERKAADGNPIIEFVDLCKSFGPLQVLKGVNLPVSKGKTTVIIGQSGVGKPVLLKHAIGLIRPTSGKVFVDGQEISHLPEKDLIPIRKRFGVLFQSSALFDSMSVGMNVAFPLGEHRKDLSKEEIEGLVSEKLRLVGLKGVENKMPAELSGGMKKRVALARALILEPEILLYDEPTTGLDPVMSTNINHLIMETEERLGITTFVISHDIKGAMMIGDVVAMLYDGRIVFSGPPEMFKETQEPVVRQFLEGAREGPIQVL